MVTMMSSKNSIPGWVWFVVGSAVILGSVLLYVHFAPKNDYSYHGFPIEKEKCAGTDLTCWFVALKVRDKPYTISFYNHPSAVEDIPVAPAALHSVLAMQQRANHTVTIAVPKNAPGEIGIASVALAQIMGSKYGIMNLNVKGAEYGTDVDCSDANAQHLIITFHQEPLTAVTQPSPNCIVLGATNATDTIAVADAFAYHILGVIPTFERQ
jgi:hypothetical protein